MKQGGKNMITVKELKEWLHFVVGPDEEVFIDEGGLTLHIKGCGCYLEVGGDPDEHRDDREDFFDE
jgi:hypothetical protein